MVLFLPPCRPSAWHKLRGTDSIYVVGNKSKWKFKQEGTLPFHNMIIVPVSGALLLPFRSLRDFNISALFRIQTTTSGNMLTFNIQITFWLSSTMLQQAVFFIYFFTDSRQFPVLIFLLLNCNIVKNQFIWNFSFCANSKINTEQRIPFLLSML